jgi:hypothetical protein
LNIAFPAVVIILLVLPGVIFNRCRSVSGRFKSQHQIADELFPSLGAAAIAHLAWVCGCYALSSLTGLYVDIEATLLLIAGQLGKTKDSVNAIEAVSNHPVAVLVYFSSLLLVCYGGGCFIQRWRLRRHGYTKALMMFAAEDESQARRVAEWADTLHVEIPGEGLEVAVAVVLSVVVGSKAYLYAGWLRNVFWDETTGEPVWFQLYSTIRRDILADKTLDKTSDETSDKHAEAWYPVEGESFMIRSSTVDTINLIYSTIEADDESFEPVSPHAELPA